MESKPGSLQQDVDILHGFYQRAMQLNAKQQKIIDALRSKLKERDAEIDALEAELAYVVDKAAREVEMLAQQQDWQKRFMDNEVAKRDKVIAQLEHTIGEVQSRLDKLNAKK